MKQKKELTSEGPLQKKLDFCPAAKSGFSRIPWGFNLHQMQDTGSMGTDTPAPPSSRSLLY